MKSSPLVSGLDIGASASETPAASMSLSKQKIVSRLLFDTETGTCLQVIVYLSSQTQHGQTDTSLTASFPGQPGYG